MAGRCICGLTGSDRKVQLHVLTCVQYLELYRQDPGRCPAPAELHRLHKATHDSSMVRAARRDVRLRQRFVELDRTHVRAAQRWATPADLLAD